MARSRSTPVPGKHHKDAPGRHFIPEGFSVAPLAVVIAWPRRWPRACRHPYRRALIDDRMSLERAPAKQPFAIPYRCRTRAMMPASHEGERDACGSFTSASADMRRLSGPARTGGRRRQISQPSDALGRRLRGRRAERHHRARVLRLAVGSSRPAVRGREQRRPGRHDRGEFRDQFPARRLHHHVRRAEQRHRHRRCTRTCRSTSCATPRRSPASCSSPTSWWCRRRCR